MTKQLQLIQLARLVLALPLLTTACDTKPALHCKDSELKEEQGQYGGACGHSYCNPDQFCCNPSCSSCAGPGEGCLSRECHQDAEAEPCDPRACASTAPDGSCACVRNACEVCEWSCD